MLVSKKLLFNIILFVGIILILLSGCIVYPSNLILKKILISKSNEQFSIIRDLKQQELEDFFGNLKKEVLLLSQEQLIKSSFKEFELAFAKQIDHTYVYSKYHNYFEKIIKNLNYTNILLLNFNGNIIYNVKKEFNFFPSVMSNAFVDSEILSVFHAIKDNRNNKDYVVVSNFTEFSLEEAEPVILAAIKVGDDGILVASIAVSKINSLLKLPENINKYTPKTSLYLVDQMLHSINNNESDKLITSTISIKEDVFSYQGKLTEIKETNKEIKFNYLAPIKGTLFNLILEVPQQEILKDLPQFFKYMLYIVAVVIPLLLIFIYAYCFFNLKKDGKKINKINDFVQVVMTKKDLNKRIELTDSSNHVAGIINNMLSWFQDTLGKLAFKIRNFIDQYNNLLSSINMVANNVAKGLVLLQNTKSSVNQIVTQYHNLKQEYIEHQNVFNQIKKHCSNLQNLSNCISKPQDVKNLNNAIEYIFNICNLANLLSVQISMEARKKNKQGRNLLILSKEIKQITRDLKLQLLKIKSCLYDYKSEFGLVRNFFDEITEQTNVIAHSIEKLHNVKDSSFEIDEEKLKEINKTQDYFVELETKYADFTQQLLKIVDNNVKLNPEAQLDDYYSIKIIEGENT